ncbi:MAG: nodulation protein NfeD [Firmicutes bacterium]|nr:nodulation protein NfeD [Bacillota bacterium]
MGDKISYRIVLSLLILLGLVWAPLSGDSRALAANGDVIHIIPIEGDIDLGLVPYLARSLEAAKGAGARAVILDINTFGGRVDGATQLKDHILAAPLPTAAFVHNRAWSAGALITLAADHIIMAPGSSIGAAEPRLGDEPADEKTVSALREEFAATAEATGRDPRLAAAMVDADIAIPDIIASGKLLSLSAQQALELGLADVILGNYQEIIDYLGYPQAELIFSAPTTAEKISRFVTSPLVSPLLLTIGFTGLVIELYTAGWGISGTVGLLSLGLYFGGHLVAGLAGWWVVGLFLAGVFLLLLELLVIPGFGLVGVSGILAILGSILLATGDFARAITYLVVALGATLLLVVFLLRYITKTHKWRWLILGDRLDKEHGYVAPRDLSSLTGKEGIALTPLRPAGAAEIEGGRQDVISEGIFIPAGTKIKVIRVEGGRVLVHPIRETYGKETE